MISGLENFQLGMGLVSVPGQVIPTKNAVFDGYSEAVSVNFDKRFLLIGVAVLILLFFVK